jgi:uncharacterized protein (TIGR02594 family)
MQLPNGLEWLGNEKGPLMLVEALKLTGITEGLEKINNPTIMEWAEYTKQELNDVYLADSVPWCGLFMAYVAKKANKKLVPSPLWALGWSNFGNFSSIPMLGDVLVFNRLNEDGTKGGHVGIYVGEESDYFYVLGGNQADSVCFRRIAKKRLYVCRRPKYNNQPINVRVIHLNIDIPISTDSSQA